MIDGLHLVIVGKDVEGMYRSWEGLPHPPSLSGSAKFHWTAMVNERGRPLASIGNSFLDRYYPIQVFGLVHADCSFGPGSLEAFYECAMAGNVCGIAGRDPGKGNRWCCNTEEKTGDVVASLRPGPVSTLDSCAVFFRRDLGLRFDEVTFDGFHCHVEDLCLQAHAKGIPVVVPEADASHRGDSTFDSEWQRQYRIYRGRLAYKWKGVAFETT